MVDRAVGENPDNSALRDCHCYMLELSPVTFTQFGLPDWFFCRGYPQKSSIRRMEASDLSIFAISKCSKMFQSGPDGAEIAPMENIIQR